MNSTAIDAQDASSSPTQAVTDFHTEARVILHGLLKAPDLNGKKGIVRSILSSSGRHTVYIEELDKCLGLRPSNLIYEPILVESLSVKELKMVLKYETEQSADIAGMEKSDLEAQVSNLIESPDELPALLAKAKTKADANLTSTTASRPKAAEQLGNMSPDQLRQQARMMKTMDPSAVRRMNPQLANMTDSQLKMAADRMEMMANNPSMMKMAVEQMEKMDPAQLQKMQTKFTGGDNSNSNTARVENNSSAMASHSAGISTPSVNQAQQAAKMMQNMNSDQLRHQAQMLKTMDPDVLRRTNPQMAHMSDAQIKMAAMQFEMMASNPAMMKIATDQMTNATPEELEAMSKGQFRSQKGLDSSAETTNMASFADSAQMGGDPAEMLANIDTTQLKELLNVVKDDPEMLKQYAGMVGINEDQLKQGVESFAAMDDAKIDAALKMMKIVQKAKGTWNQLDAKTGGHLKKFILAMVVLVIVWIVRYLFFPAQTGSTVESIAFSEDEHYETGDSLESEF